MKAKTVTTVSPFGLPKCPLCGHELTISVLVARERDPFNRNGPMQDKTCGVDGTCAACGFKAERRVEGESLQSTHVQTVLVVCPDEPEPIRLAEFEEFADKWVGRTSFTGGKPYPAAPPPFRNTTPPVSAGVFFGVDSSKAIDFGKAIRFDTAEFHFNDEIEIDGSLLNDVVGNMKATLDRMTAEAMGIPKSMLQPRGTLHQAPGSHIVTQEFFNDHVRPLVKVTNEELNEMDKAGLIEIGRWAKTYAFTPSPGMPFDGSPRSIAAEFRIRKLFLQVRKLKQR